MKAAQSGAAALVPPIAVHVSVVVDHVARLWVAFGRDVGHLTAVAAARCSAGRTGRVRVDHVQRARRTGLVGGHRPRAGDAATAGAISISLSFHTVWVGGGPIAERVVPPTPVTYGWLAGSSTARDLTVAG